MTFLALAAAGPGRAAATGDVDAELQMDAFIVGGLSAGEERRLRTFEGAAFDQNPRGAIARE